MAARSFGPAYLKRTVRFNATRKGLLGGSRPWLVVFGLLRLAAWSGKVTKRGDAPVKFGESLQPGESFVITHIAPPKKERRRRGGPAA
ncbi:MAG: hypothetical protein AAF081_14525 [Actinomycetota bacterium]